MRDKFFWGYHSTGYEVDLTAASGPVHVILSFCYWSQAHGFRNFRRPQMKNLMSLMLGLSLLVGATAMFANDKTADTTKTTKKAKKAKKAKPTTTDKTTKTS
jgi:hypothetical protein